MLKTLRWRVRDFAITKSTRFMMWVADKIPTQLVYFTLVRVWAWYTVKANPNAIASEVTLSDALQAWDEHYVRPRRLQRVARP